MIFSSLEFILFFAFVLLGLASLRNNHTGRKVLLLVASYYFYAYWDWRFLSLIWLSTVVDYVVGKRLALATKETIRRRWLLVSLTVNLGLLGYFKYYNFFIDSFKPLVESIGLHSGSLDIILPVGISFYTFQTLSYTIDIYRRNIKPRDSFLDFALFVGFFPQLVAGPIVRASHFLPQLESYKPLTRAHFFAGFQLFTYGLFKKVFIADRLAMFSDNVFANPGAYDSPTSWLVAVAYSMQIYFDFSGYSDMAIGVARIMGYDLGENFNFPYLSKSPREFWRRWHISLSSWIRDYLYIPLGGSWRSPARTYVNLLFSMTLCGLWHGAAWTFVAWGALHGLALAKNRLWMQNGPKTDSKIIKMTGWVLTMLSVIVGWVIFRSPSFEDAGLMLRQMFFPEQGVSWMNPFVIFILVGTVAVHILEYIGKWNSWAFPSSSRWYSPTLLFSLLWLSIMFFPDGFNPFIYFQF
ncbi:MAG: MBOAT family protein [Pseudodesulfovibrio sp.]|nr:MBOAT family protein [Pseudodesulfovibrio sp.]